MKRMDELSENLDRFKKLIGLFDVSHMGLWEMDPEGSVIFYNENFYKNFDIPSFGSTLADWTALIHPEDQKLFDDHLEDHKSTQVESFKSEYRVFDKEGTIVWIEAQGVATFDDNNQMLWMVGSHTDITLQKDYEDKLYNEAYIDQLTGLHNKKGLLKQLNHDKANHIPGKLVVIEFVQLIRLINIYGQNKVNNLIKEGVCAFSSLLSSKMDLYRINMNQFAFILREPCSQEHIEPLMVKVRNGVLGLLSKYDMGSTILYQCAVLEYPLEDSHLSGEDIFNRCAMILNDEQVDAVTYYTSDTSRKVLKKLFIETNMHKSIELGEFYPVFQPIICTTRNRLLGFEVLCRWENPEWGAIYPDEFIGIAEENLAILDIGQHMLHEACNFIHHYNRKYQTDLTVSVNFSVTEIFQSNFFDDLRRIMASHQTKPESLIIEITESTMLEKDQQILQQLEQLKKEGVGIALDDFGTGYASISTMMNVPITEVKFDRELMLQLKDNPMLNDFMESLIKVLHKHQVIVVAEGIENEDMISRSIELHMDCLQGYVFSKPMKKEEALNYDYLDL